MTDKKVWFITGAGRGMGVDIAKAGGAALVVEADITDRTQAEAAVLGSWVSNGTKNRSKCRGCRSHGGE